MYYEERAYFKQVCLYIPSDKSVHTVVKITWFLISISTYFYKKMFVI